MIRGEFEPSVTVPLVRLQADRGGVPPRGPSREGPRGVSGNERPRFIAAAKGSAGQGLPGFQAVRAAATRANDAGRSQSNSC